jgi:signal transduction histidine kinase
LTHIRQPSLLLKILLSTSIAITLLLGITGWFVQDEAVAVLSSNLQSEIQASFRAYESLWKLRTDMLRSVSTVLSSMSDVRAAFRTNDRATIRDTAAEIWSKISDSTALFVVTDPRGGVIASLGGAGILGNDMPAVRAAASKFPEQSAGFVMQNGRLYELVVTPVYVEMGNGPGLLNVLVAGFPVDRTVADDFRQRTGASDFIFAAGGVPVASTLPTQLSGQISAAYQGGPAFQHVTSPGGDFAVLGSELASIEGNPIGQLLIVRSFDAVLKNRQMLERKLVLVWVLAIAAGLALSFLLARRLLKPVKQLDEAATRIARQEYETRVPEGANDELGRLARTFNAMCGSIQQARQELIRQERILTIGRLSTSIVHDLRNPLAAIYGGAEMMIDGELSETQMKRVAGNIYRASRIINTILQELVEVSRGRMQAPELCSLSEVVGAAVGAEISAAEQQGVAIQTTVDETLELPLERGRMERVFLNLISNALEAMPNGGCIKIQSERSRHEVLIHFKDTGPGIPSTIREMLFQPFTTARKNGLGLGLALSRQTVLDHGGDLWLENEVVSGAHFCMRLPL